MSEEEKYNRWSQYKEVGGKMEYVEYCETVFKKKEFPVEIVLLGISVGILAGLASPQFTLLGNIIVGVIASTVFTVGLLAFYKWKGLM